MYSVLSWPELWTVAYAWQVYTVIVEVIVQSGVIYIPFIIIIFSHVGASIKKAGIDGGLYAYRAIAFDSIVMLMFISLFFYPLREIGYEQLAIKPIDERSNPNTVEFSTLDTTVVNGYDTEFAGIKVPLGFYYLNQLLHGAGLAATARLGEASDLRQMETLFQMASIDDPVLNSDVRRFMRDCYARARNKYDQVIAANPTTFMQEVLRDTPDDLEWLGSKILLRTKGLYHQCENSEMSNAVCHHGDGFQANSHVSDMDFNVERGDYVDVASAQRVSLPYCSQWWTGSTSDGVISTTDNVGLREKILDYASTLKVVNPYTQETEDAQSWWDKVNLSLAAIEGFYGETDSANDREEAVIRHILTNTARNTYTVPTWVAEDQSGIATSIGSIGAAIEYMTTSVKVQVIKNSLYIVLAMTIFGFIIVLPFLMLFGMFEFSVLLIPIVAFTVMKVTPFMWHVVNVLDSVLIKKMGLDESWAKTFGYHGNESAVHSQNSFIIDITVMSLYVGLPLILTMILNTVARGASAVGQTTGENSKGTEKAADNSKGQAQQGMSKVQGAATKGMSNK